MADSDRSAGDQPDYGADLIEAVEGTLAGWVMRSVRRFRADLDEPATVAATLAVADTVTRLRVLLATDVDQQRSNPLAELRVAVKYPTAVLQAAGVAPVMREPFAVRAFPDDVYDLSPATWVDIDPSLQDPGISWSAWKAHTVLRRRRDEGKR
jgi:hypothetical protein